MCVFIESSFLWFVYFVLFLFPLNLCISLRYDNDDVVDELKICISLELERFSRFIEAIKYHIVS